MQNIDRILRSDELVKLVQGNNFVGWIYRIDYDTAWLITNDLWKVGVLGIPHNAFLVAASFDPDQFATVPPEEREVILLRVVGTARLPQDDDLVRAKVDHYQQQRGTYESTGASDYDDITRNQMQFGGLECRVLGTFYVKEGELYLGSDLESFVTAGRLNVYRPRGEALRMIVNHVDPLRRRRAVEEAQQLGIEDPIRDFRIGTVRYTSTDRLHRRDEAERVPVTIQPSDFLPRRTAVLGMTRTGADSGNQPRLTARIPEWAPLWNRSDIDNLLMIWKQRLLAHILHITRSHPYCTRSTQFSEVLHNVRHRRLGTIHLRVTVG